MTNATTDAPVKEKRPAATAKGKRPGAVRSLPWIAASAEAPVARPWAEVPSDVDVYKRQVHAIDDVVADIRANGLVHDVTLSGGEPFEQAAAASELARRLKTLGYGIWTYTGYLYDCLLYTSRCV